MMEVGSWKKIRIPNLGLNFNQVDILVIIFSFGL